MPSLSTIAPPSAGDLAALQDQIEEERVLAIFVGESANESLAQQIADGIEIQVVIIYTESLSKANGPAASYLDFMRHNMTMIVSRL
ncbi:metal ABC transporter substrate-binding protein [Chloroflexi bacterium TSY]|nr:metal ABC transporter substrate-binding protein [Chloroflexi bacterium TSY]